LYVQLINPPQRISAANLVSAVAIPPLGTAYLAAELERAGHRVSVVDAVGAGLEHVFTVGGRSFRGLDFRSIVEGLDPQADLIGLGVMYSSSWPGLRDLVGRIKARFPQTPLVLGGEHPTALPELVFEQSPADFVVMGEGEETLLELCDRFGRRQDLGDVRGLAFRTDDGTIRINPRRARVRDLDALPLPAWHYFDIERYIRFAQPHGSSEGRSMPMLATRGCPFQCTFCGSPGMWGTTWRARAPVKVVDEMESYVHRYNANDFHFEDLTAVVRRGWILDFCREVIRRRLKVTWQLPSGTRSEAIDAEVARAMHAAGCRQFSYALEAGSPEILRRIKKRIHPNRVFSSAEKAIAAGIRVQSVFIYGFPNETWRQMWQTWCAMLRCAVVGFHEVSICALQPLPNTEIYREIDRERSIALTDDYFDSIFGYLGIWQQRSWNPRVPTVVLRLIILFSLASFFLVSFMCHPNRVIGTFRGLFSARSGGKFAKILKGMVRNIKLIGHSYPAS